jgi:hypothetical protein
MVKGTDVSIEEEGKAEGVRLDFVEIRLEAQGKRNRDLSSKCPQSQA